MALEFFYYKLKQLLSPCIAGGIKDYYTKEHLKIYFPNALLSYYVSYLKSILFLMRILHKFQLV